MIAFLVKLWAASVIFLFTIAFVVLRQLHRHTNKHRTIHIFHVAADAGGGGEKCLWALIQAFTLKNDRKTHLNLYTHSNVAHVQTLLQKVHTDFGIDIQSRGVDRCTTYLKSNTRLSVRRLHLAQYAHAKWPVCQHLGEIITSILIGVEATFTSIGSHQDEIWDTQGLCVVVCTYSLLTSLFTRPVRAYIHWPWLSDPFVAKQKPSKTRSIYYALLSYIYLYTGRCYTRPICVNSAFTEERLQRLWKLQSAQVVKILPPVNTTFAEYQLEKKEETVLSIGQFRPEKNHVQQIRAISRLLHRYSVKNCTRFCICGSTTSLADEARVASLYDFALECCGSKCRIILENYLTKKRRISLEKGQCRPTIEFHVNIPQAKLQQMIAKAKVGLHTMKHEHFGIAIVDLMLAGAVVVAHDSGGPKLDILRALDEKGSLIELGFLADSDDEYADYLKEALDMTPAAIAKLRAVKTPILKHFLSNLDFGKKLLREWGTMNVIDDKKEG